MFKWDESCVTSIFSKILTKMGVWRWGCTSVGRGPQRFKLYHETIWHSYVNNDKVWDHETEWQDQIKCVTLLVCRARHWLSQVKWIQKLKKTANTGLLGQHTWMLKFPKINNLITSHLEAKKERRSENSYSSRLGRPYTKAHMGAGILTIRCCTSNVE